MSTSVSDPVFKCVAECRPVKGSRRSIIYDLSRHAYDFIPNTLYEILVTCDGSGIEEVKRKFEDPEIITEYFDFLFRNEYIFLCKRDDLRSFPPLQLTWEDPSYINSAVVSLNARSVYDIELLLRSLEQLGCRHIFIRVEEKQDMDYFQGLLGHFSKSAFLSVELEAPYIPCFSIPVLKALLEEHPRIRAFICHGAPDSYFMPSPHLSFGMIAWLTDGMAPLHTSPNLKEYFNVNIQLFSEAQYHNVYFNRKVFIDTEGYICNSPIPGNRYGHISKDSLPAIIGKPGFRQFWNIPKDRIEVCKDCEFRYMCMDNRIPVENSAGAWSHSTECEYNPYLALWKNEEGYKPISQMSRKKQEGTGNPP